MSWDYERKGTRQMKISVQEGTEKAFEKFPGLKRAELETVNDDYDHYLFYEKSGTGRKFWSSCCHQRERFLSMDARKVTPRQRNALCCRHGAVITCPFCGKTVTLKAKGTVGHCKSLLTYIPVVFLSAADHGETIYAQAYWTKKDYDCNWAAEPLYMPTYVYRFRRGEAVQWEAPCYGDEWNKQINGFLKDPFRSGSYLFLHYDDYQVIGMDCLKESFLRYINYEGCRNKYGTGYGGMMRLMALAAQYPENTEMLQKAGMREVLKDWVYNRVKNAANIRWGEKDPRKAFGLDGGELKAFLQTDRSMGVLALYKSMRKQGMKMSMEECLEIKKELGCSAARDLKELAREHDTTAPVLLKYLRRAAGNWSLSVAVRTWKDYITAAEQMEKRTYRDDIKFPKNLRAAHEEVTEQNRKRLEAEHRRRLRMEHKEQQERRRLEKLAFAQRKKALEKRYAYAADGFCIRIPQSREEIVQEGKTLQHCVGGYADRYIEGKVTILFLRRGNEPDRPFLTIEINGSELVQIHGFKNEGLYTTKGRFAPDPREEYREFLDPWLAWVAAGSRRNKRGEPIRRENRVEVQIA